MTSDCHVIVTDDLSQVVQGVVTRQGKRLTMRDKAKEKSLAAKEQQAAILGSRSLTCHFREWMLLNMAGEADASRLRSFAFAFLRNAT